MQDTYLASASPSSTSIFCFRADSDWSTNITHNPKVTCTAYNESWTVSYLQLTIAYHLKVTDRVQIVW